MKPRRFFLPLAILAVALTLGSAVFAQRFGRSRRAMRTEQPPAWANAQGFEKDVFTFVRIQYSSAGYRGRGGGWDTDWPDAELNLSYRLQQMTSMKVDPQGKVLTIGDPELFRYPFIYIVEPGGLTFEDSEVPILRRYLLNGGFLMIDDFWGDDEWENLEAELRRVFPDRKIVDLPRTHPIFHSVFDIPNELNLQLPSLGWASDVRDGVTWETNKRYDTDTNAHFRAILDDKGRICVMICHNTDNGDGWEREGENQFYFREFSEKKAYPLGINIIFYAMTH
ncbi:MAG TPA: DUF4159 domain-containing protein [Chthoniobacteraceae bacterium]